MERVAIVGSRDWPHTEDVTQYVATLAPGTTVVSGGAIGVDTWAEEAAIEHGLETIIFKPDYKKYSKRMAPLLRNNDIVAAADRVVAFHFNNSGGTRNTISIAKLKKKPVTLFAMKP